MTKFKIMSMKCPECGWEITQPVISCPHCGAPYIKDKVKAIILGFFKKPKEDEVEDTAEIRKWKRIRSISSCIETIGGIVIIILISLLLTSLKGDEAVKNFDSILKNLVVFSRLMLIVPFIPLTALMVFMVASHKIKKAQTIQKQKSQKK